MPITFDDIMRYHLRNREVYEEIKRALGQLLPFVGAGLTADVYGTWPTALRELGKKIFDKQTRAGLDRLIDSGDLLGAADYLEEVVGNNLFRDITHYFSRYKLTNHADFPERMAIRLLPELFRCPVITTNFDEAIELIYEKCDFNPFYVLDPTDQTLVSQAAWGGSTPCVVKLHGSVKGPMVTQDRLIFTSSQYDKHYYDESPVQQELKTLLNIRPLLFLGCGLEKDRTMDVMRACVAQGRNHYAILPCEERNFDQRSRELINEFSICAIFYPKGRYEAVRVILERLLQETNPDAYQRLSDKASAPQPPMPANGNGVNTPANEENALADAENLVSLSFVQDTEEAIARTVGRIEELYRKHPRNADIAREFARGLTNLSFKQATKEARARTVGRIADLYWEFPGDAGIAWAFALGLASLSEKQATARARARTVGRIEELYREYPDDAEIAQEFAWGLYNLSFKQNTEEAIASTVGRIEELYREYPDDAKIAEAFARGLNNLSFKQATEEAEATVECIDELYSEYPGNAAIAREYASGLRNLIFKQDAEEAEATVERLRCVHEAYRDDAYIKKTYATALGRLTHRSRTP